MLRVMATIRPPRTSAPPLEEVTLCLIVKDEQAFLGECLRAVAPACGAVVIVDTGSSDGTPEIAAGATSEVISTSMDGGYSAARNLALDRVETPWVLFLDADERLQPADLARLGAALREADEDVFGFRLLRYNISATGGFTAERILRVFRNHPEIRYRRIVGESVDDSLSETGGRVLDAPVIVNHFGEMRPLAVREAKTERYLRLLAEQAAGEPDNGVWPAYSALLLRSQGRFERALDQSRRAVDRQPELAVVWLCHGHVLRARNELDAAAEAYRRGLELEPADGTLRNMLGVVQLCQGDLDAAEATLARAAADDPELVHVEINRGLVAQARGDYAAAAERFEQAARRNPPLAEHPWAGSAVADPFGPLRAETIPHFRGLGYHLGYCQRRRGELHPEAGR